MHGVRLFLTVTAGSFRRYATYRVATAAGVFTNTVFGFILSYTFLALWSERPQLGGYDQAQALTFVWTGQALLSAVALMGGGVQEDLQARIRSGDVVVDLYRPVDLQAWWLAADIGRAAFQLLGRGIVPMLIGALVFELALPSSPLTWLSFLVSAWLGVVVGFALRYLLALATFWLLDGTGLNTFGVLLSIFFSGMLLPLTVFPGVFGDLVRQLPWAAMMQVPADVLLAEYRGAAGVAGAFAFQAVWAVVLLTAGRVLQAAATRKVVVQGG
jgi:ABC-2 type transport system permease protein